MTTPAQDKHPVRWRPRRSRGLARVLGRMAWLALGAALALLAARNPAGWPWLEPWRARLVGTQGVAAEAEPGQLWTCGMHPQVIQDRPGNCPICGMKLVPLQAAAPGRAGAGAAGKQAREVLFYRHPMDPTITSPVPKQDEMGMDYVPVYADEASVREGGAVVTIDPAIVQNLGVVTAKVERRDVTRRIRTVGYLDYDQEKMVSITTKYEGFVEKTYVNYIGQRVREGEPLFEVYSPELVQTQQELLSAIEFARGLPPEASAEVRQRAFALVDAARRRLAYWDITPEQIARIETTGQIMRTLTVVSPLDGIVMRRTHGLEGTAIRPGMDVMHLADLSSLWLTVEVFEHQLPWLREGSRTHVTLDYFPGEVFEGRVRFIEPEVSEKTRTVKLTLEVANPEGKLRAGMYATVEFEPVVVRDAIAVPAHAVLRTGLRDVVIAALGDGRFEPREVLLGPEGDGWVQVLRGLEDGEEIVVSSQFLIDSESNLREAIQKMVASASGHRH